jgi:hypothetical protein
LLCVFDFVFALLFALDLDSASAWGYASGCASDSAFAFDFGCFCLTGLLCVFCCSTVCDFASALAFASGC